MLAAAERLNGAKLDFDADARAALQKGTYKTEIFALPLALTVEKLRKKEEPKAAVAPQAKEEPKAPRVWYSLLTASDTNRPTWRSYAWAAATYTQPVMDNLHPAGTDMANWHLPGFDDTSWKQGHLPMNDGPQVSPTNPVFKAHKELYQGYCIFYNNTPFCNRFLRTQFTLDNPDAVDAMRSLRQGRWADGDLPERVPGRRGIVAQLAAVHAGTRIGETSPEGDECGGGLCRRGELQRRGRSSCRARAESAASGRAKDRRDCVRAPCKPVRPAGWLSLRRAVP